MATSAPIMGHGGQAAEGTSSTLRTRDGGMALEIREIGAGEFDRGLTDVLVMHRAL
ncbi:MAG TPA: hypothetical protein VMR21_01915 [Vicinamibacteria bacterium]|nr:hypothetical protein [Vicinamibacteria bacterium]